MPAEAEVAPSVEDAPLEILEAEPSILPVAEGGQLRVEEAEGQREAGVAQSSSSSSSESDGSASEPFFISSPAPSQVPSPAPPESCPSSRRRQGSHQFGIHVGLWWAESVAYRALWWYFVVYGHVCLGIQQQMVGVVYPWKESITLPETNSHRT